MYEKECVRLVEKGLVLPAYDYVMKCSHTFNLLDARGAISVTERASYIGKVRNVARLCAEGYLQHARAARLSAVERRPLMAKELFLEIGCEEIPAGFIPKAMADMEAAHQAGAGERAAFDFGEIVTLGTPRRLVLAVKGFADRSSPMPRSRPWAPRKVSPSTPTATRPRRHEGFARGQGVEVSAAAPW